MNDGAKQSDDLTSEDAVPSGDSPLAEEKVKLAAAIKQEQQKFFQAFSDFIIANRTEAHTIGWEEGFLAGWGGAMKHFQDEAQKKAREAAMGAKPPQPPENRGHLYSRLHDLLADSGGTSTARPPAIITVQRFIRRNPGLRGVEIAAALAKSFPERTVRTALHRLKTAGHIRIEEGRWHPVTPTPPNSSQEKADAPP
ncbi:hypothetical protein [Methylocystis sp.]|uniref:hypothetical protein n=1 Tax=Methylocystis sp. TaxID=1911079 RepID=UPI003DA67C29